MFSEQLVTVGIAAVCILGIGMCAATMDTTVTTYPQDVVDVDAAWMPISSDDVGELKRRVAQPAHDGERSATRERQRSGAGDVEPADRSAAGERREAASQQSDADDRRDRATGGEDAGERPVRDLLESLLLLVGLLVLGWLVYRYRDRLTAFVRSRGDRGQASRDRREPSPGDPVSRAWYGMVERLDVPDRTTMTPEECARVAIEAGYDSDAVQTLTRVFQEVTYGNRPVTDERVRLAEGALDAVERPPSTSRGI